MKMCHNGGRKETDLSAADVCAPHVNMQDLQHISLLALRNKERTWQNRKNTRNKYKIINIWTFFFKKNLSVELLFTKNSRFKEIF